MKWGIMVMNLKTSFINPGILRNDFKRFTWISVVYLLGLLFTVPLTLYLMYTAAEKNGLLYHDYLRTLQFSFDSSPFALMLIIIVPVLTGMLLFRYLQSSKAADMVHSLPIKRETLYNTHLLSGIIFLFIPLIITALVTWGVISGLGIDYLRGQDVLVWLGINLLINLLFFMTSVATAMITGMSTVQGVLSYILLFLPTGFSVLLLYNLQMYVYGFALDYYINRINISPLQRIMEFSSYPILTSEITAYFLISVVLYFVGKYLYQQRQLERAGNAITFDVLKPLFKYGVTFCAMLVMGSYFCIATASMGWTYFGYFLGSLIGYFLMEILFHKSLHIFHWPALKGYGTYSLIAILLIAGLHFDFSGYEHRQPVLAEVESTYLDSTFTALNYRDQHIISPSQYYNNEINYPPVKPIFTEKTNIASIYTLHQNIISQLAEEKQGLLSRARNTPSAPICLAYTLKNGRHVYRQYYLTSGKFDRQLKPIAESTEYKQLHNEIRGLDPDNVHLIDIQVDGLDKNAGISDPEQIRQAINVLQKDILQQSYADLNDRRTPWARIDIHTKDHHIVNLSWNKSFRNFERWLKAAGLYEQARINPGEDVFYAIVSKSSAGTQAQNTAWAYVNRPSSEEIADYEQQPGAIKITDSVQLETCLQTYIYGGQQDYHVVFLLKNGMALYGGFMENNVPAFIK